MITYNFPLIGGKLVERKIAQWRAEGFAQGRAEGKAQENAIWSAWNSRRVEAERRGVPFGEPPPDDGARAGFSGKELA